MSGRIEEILVLHHSHLDVGYTHPQPVVWRLQSDYLDQVLDYAEETADWPDECRFRWTCEATAPLLRWLNEASGGQVDRFRRLALRGQIDVAALPMHTTPLCDAEQLARLLYPVPELRERTGLPIRVAINHDVNGQPWPLASLLLDAGVDVYLTGINIHFGGIPMSRPRVFRWRTSDGRTLRTFLGEHYSLFTQITQSWRGDLEVVAEGLRRYLDRLQQQGYPYDFACLTATNVPMLDNTPPDPALPRLIRTWNEEGRSPRLRLVTAEMLRDRILSLPESALEEVAGDWTDYWNFGAGSSAAETRLNRRTKHLLETAEWISAFQGWASPRARDAAARAWEQVNLFDEHTWGASESVSHPDSAHTRAQWAHKAHFAHEGNGLAWYALARQLDHLAENPLQSDATEGWLLVNPTPVPQRVHVPCPEPHELDQRTVSAGRMRFPSHIEDEPWEKAQSAAVEVPALGWRTLRRCDVRPAPPAPGMHVGRGIVESPYFRLRYEPETGRITELYDRVNDWQVLDDVSEWTFFEFVQETVDARLAPEHRATLFPRDVAKCNDSISCWNHGWPARRRGTHRLVAWDVFHHAAGGTLRLVWEAPGVGELIQRITLLAEEPRLELEARFDKQDIRTPESLYFAFPLRLGSWNAWYDTAGLWVRMDDEQLPRVCRDWVTVDTGVCVADDSHGMLLACPDAPLVQVGGFRFGLESPSLERSGRPLLLAWPVNNYWDTNFRASQPGPLAIRYSVSTFRSFDPVWARHEALRVTRPAQVWPVTRLVEPGSGTFVTVCGDGVSVLHAKAAEDGRGLILRLVNHREVPERVQIELTGRDVAVACWTSPAEEDLEPVEGHALAAGRLAVQLPSRRIVSLRIVPIRLH